MPTISKPPSIQRDRLRDLFSELFVGEIDERRARAFRQLMLEVADLFLTDDVTGGAENATRPQNGTGTAEQS